MEDEAREDTSLAGEREADNVFYKIVEQHRGKWKKRKGEGREGERKTCLDIVVETRVRTGGEERGKKRTEWQLGRE